jgi:UDP-2,4-diacetamido-2,4,6-trideoxy-beta-L-altropyranose hydrolase
VPIDAAQTVTALLGRRPDWLVVDHYALDMAWEGVLAEHASRLLVIDDLADRGHRCDLLLDQNLGREAADYAARVPTGSRVLVGPRYALLRPEFAALREYSLSRRAGPAPTSILVTMGGIDRDNATAAVLKALRNCVLPGHCRIRVVMGAAAPWLAQVRELAAQMPWPTELCVDVENMAQLMADSDLAVGAAGTTSWERCCLGLPTLMLVLADNQRHGANALVTSGAAILLDDLSALERSLPEAMRCLVHGERLTQLAAAAAQVTDGLGVERVVAEMGAFDD